MTTTVLARRGAASALLRALKLALPLTLQLALPLTLLFALHATVAAAQAPRVLTIGDAARLAARQGVGLEAASYRVDAAEARVRQQRAAFLPQISGAMAQGERTFNTASLGLDIRDPATGRDLFPRLGEVRGPVRAWDARIAVRQDLLDPAAFARLRAARGAAAASAVEASYASQQVAAAAAAAYVEAARADALLTARNADSSLAAGLLTLARNQLAAGTGITLDVTRAEAQCAVTRSQLIAARTDRARARLQLERLLGLPPGTPVVLADSVDDTPSRSAPPVDDASMTSVVRAREDLRLLDAQIDAGRRQLTAIRAERLPVLSAVADQGGTGPRRDALPTTYSWAVQLSLPIFDGFRREGRIAEQRAALKELDARRRDQAQLATLELREALLDLESSRALVTAAGERETLARRELDQSRGRYAAGVAGNADVITALLALNEARARSIDARSAEQRAVVSLARARGAILELP